MADETNYRTSAVHGTGELLAMIGASLALMLQGIGDKQALGFALVVFDPDATDNSHGFMTNVVDQNLVMRMLNAAAKERTGAPPLGS